MMNLDGCDTDSIYAFLLQLSFSDSNREVRPDLIFDLFNFTIKKNNNFDNSLFGTFTDSTNNNILSDLYYKKYYGEDKDQINKFKNRFLSALSLSLSVRNSSRSYDNSFENQFSVFFSQIMFKKQIFSVIINYLSKQIEKYLRENPIKSGDFPRFVDSTNSTDSNHNNNNNKEDNTPNDEELLNNILEKKEENNNNQENQAASMFSLADLRQFYEILSKISKSFSLSPQFVNSAIIKFDSFLDNLKLKNSDNKYLFNYFRNLDPKSEEFLLYKMVLLIKMRLFMNNNQIHDFLVILLQLIILEEESNSDDQFSFKSFTNEILPKGVTRRSTIVKNVLADQIFDFSFSHDEQNDYILTKEGVFKVNSNINKQNDYKSHEMVTRVEFNSEEETKIQQYLNHCDPKSAKLTFSEGILYLLCTEERMIHRVSVSENEELTKKSSKRQKKLDKAKEHSQKEHPKKKENDEIKRENAKKAKRKEVKMTPKKLREKEKKEKRQKRKMERFEDDDEKEVNLECLQIDLQNYPVLSFGVFNNYARIVQRKSSSEDDSKITLIFTNIDLAPNDRLSYDFDDAFNTIKTDQKIIQTKFEFQLDNENKMKDVLLSKDYILFSFEDSTFQRWMIYKDGKIEFHKKINSPFLLDSNSTLKMDNHLFLYKFVPIQNEDVCGISVSQLYFPETRYFLRENNGLFLKYPFLQRLSNLVDNCTQFIMNKILIHSYTIDELKNSLDYFGDGFIPPQRKEFRRHHLALSVSPEEMGSLVQSSNSIAPQLDEIKMLIKNIKNESLQQFFIILFVKLTGVNFIYEINRNLCNSKLESSSLDNLKMFKSFIIDLYSLLPSSLSKEVEIMIRESMIFTLSISGKFLFLPDSSYQELRDLMNKFLKNDEITKIILRSFSFFMFSNISSLYFIDQAFYDKLIQVKKDVSIEYLFKMNILYVLLEIDYSSRTLKNEEFIESISPYIHVLFNHIRYILSDESASWKVIEDMLSYILCFDASNIYLSLLLEKELIETSKILYERIRKIPGVIENDKDFLIINQDIPKIDFHKEIRIVESQHPYNSKPVPLPYVKPPNKDKKNQKSPLAKRRKKFLKYTKDYYYEQFETVDFGTEADKIYLQIDNKSKLLKNDCIIISSNSSTEIFRPTNDTFNKYYVINSNKIKIKIGRYIKDSQEVKEELWGYKLILTGVKSNDSFRWKPNFYLNLYSYFIALLTEVHSNANNSTPLEKHEEEFNLILRNNIIQGIKIEDIDKYEASFLQKNEKGGIDNKQRGVSKGLSRGLSFDSQNDSQLDIKLKKNFIKDIITIKEDNPTPTKRFLDALYAKTARQNLIRLNQNNKNILETEHYFAACLFKQLGLTTTCIKFLQVINITKKEDLSKLEFPSAILSIWRNVYNLRKTLVLEYQRSKSIQNAQNENEATVSNYEKLIQDVNQKCKLLLFSTPILQFVDKEDLDNDSFTSAAKSILSFVTSKMPLSDISKLIDIRNKRLSISSQSISLMLSFLDQDCLFETSKVIFAHFYDAFNPINICLGVKQNVIEEYKQKLAKLTLKMTKNIFTQSSIAMITHQKFLSTSITNLVKCESTCEIIKTLMQMLERNKNNKSFYHDNINYILIHLLIVIAFQTEDNELIDSLVLLLISDDIDSESKKLILLCIPAFIQFMPNSDKLKALDESFAFSFLDDNKKNPSIIKKSFFWIASIIDNNKEISEKYQQFIMKVFKAIGQSFVSKSCSFIENENPSGVKFSMISFIRYLFNCNNDNLHVVIHDILSSKINNIKINESSLNDDEIFAAIGLFISFDQSLSGFRPNPIRNTFLSGTNEMPFYLCHFISLENKNLNLNENEIRNILDLHEELIKSKYFNETQNYEGEISEREINENILIASFYSFLPNVMQNINNASILMNSENFKRTLSIFEMAMRPITVRNILNNSDEKLIESALRKSTKKEYLYDGSFKFMKVNFGEIIYSQNLIRSNKDQYSVFLCNHPFDSQCSVYYELKIKKIGYKNIFVGFINPEEKEFEKAFGFGCFSYSNVFCRKSLLFQQNIYEVGDEVMEQDKIYDSLKEGDKIGCCYTPDYCYLTINGRLTPYRISNKSMKSYVPVIIIDHDEIEVEVVQNVTIVDFLNKSFDFLNPPDNFFDEKDIRKIKTESSISRFGMNDFKNETVYFIGQEVFPYYASFMDNAIESFGPYPNEFWSSDKTGFIKDIITLENNPFICKYVIEMSDSKEIIEVDSRLVRPIPKTFSMIIERVTGANFGINCDLSFLPKELQVSTDMKAIDQYTRNKTIKTYSLAFAIKMTRFLSFVLIDYLRYSKSKLLQDEGINSEEAKLIIKSLAYSIPTITQFNPTFDFKLNEKVLHQYIIFPDDQESIEAEEELETMNRNDFYSYDRLFSNRSRRILYKTPGDCFLFNLSFKIFLKKSESFISSQFLLMLLKESFQMTKDNSLSLTTIYDLIPSVGKVESICPLPDDVDIRFTNERVGSYGGNSIGFIPILLSSIPDQLPCVSCFCKRIRLSSDQVSYFTEISSTNSNSVFWEYNIEKLKKKEINKNKSFDPKDYKNYKLKLGLFTITENLDEIIVRSPFGFIQIVFLLFQSLIDSDFLYDKQKAVLLPEIFNDLLSLSSKKDPLSYPFIRPLIISMISMNGFSDHLISQKVADAFNDLSGNKGNILYPMEHFPSSSNELPLVFCIYSNLIQTKYFEKTNQNASLLFDKYDSIDHELFKLLTDETNPKYLEGSIAKTDSSRNFRFSPADSIKKRKNYQSIYLLYYYSIMLNNESHLPYPLFLFVHDWMRQHFGGFQTVVTKGDIDKYKKDENDEIHYKSATFNNDVDLECSCELINVVIKEDNSRRTIFRSSYNSYSHQVINSRQAMRHIFINNFDNSLSQDIPKDDNDKKKEEEKEKDQKVFTIYIHQLKDDEKIEVPQNGESIHVSFPLEIIIQKKGDNKKELSFGDAFVLNFKASKEQEKKYFIDHFNEIREDFDQFISLGEYDSELSKIVIKTKETTKQENNNNNNNNNNDTQDIIPAFRFNGFLPPPIYMMRPKKQIENRDDFKFYELEKIPKEITAQFTLPSLAIKQNVISLRYTILNAYNSLIESIMVNFSESKNYSPFSRPENMSWNIALSSKDNLQNLYMKQIIKPAFSMNTESKFKFINQIFMTEAQGSPSLSLVFNRFEQQKFMARFEETGNKAENKKARPLFAQFMEQVDESSLAHLKVRGDVPFKITDLIGENAIDAGGPAREIFSSLIMEMMNEHIGVFIYNPNRQHQNKYTNQEDLIPNKFLKGDIFSYNFSLDDYIDLSMERFVYAGALIAACIVSNLPQPMTLASFIWEYLSIGKVSIESIYEIDENFKELIKNAESIQNRIDSISDEEFESSFLRYFDIRDSFDNVVDLIPSGSKIRVTKDNLNEFIEAAKNYRIHEFDIQLSDLKKGFDLVMCYKNITSILHPNELKLLACGEPKCSIEQMKKLFIVSVKDKSLDNEKVEKQIKMFWDVMESFSVEERMLFIKFSSGNIGLPAPGLKWVKDIEVDIVPGKSMPIAHTCFSRVDVPLFDSQEKLAKILRASINFAGLITDSHENTEDVADFL